MRHSPHVMLSGLGAEAFVRDHDLETADADWLILPERRAQLAALIESGAGFDQEMKYGTVGAVARDAQGHVAAATSTGGITGKRWGRIGDTPVIGAGTWADDRACAVSATGSGEYFMRASAGAEIGARIRLRGEEAGVAARAVMADIAALGGTGGLIVVTPDGQALWHFITPGMFRARIGSGGERLIAILRDADEAAG